MAKEAGPRSFARFFENIGEGDFHQEASEKLFELNNALVDHALRTDARVKGKLTLVFDISIDQRGVCGVSVETTVKKPKVKRAPAQAWITKGNITFEHPRQTTLPLREVGWREPVRNDDDADEMRPAAKEV
jgi:hypothetical protein